MIEILKRNYKYLCLIPLSSIALFSFIFDTSVHRMDFSGLFSHNTSEIGISLNSSIFLLQLSTSLVICSGCSSLFASMLNLGYNLRESTDRNYFITVCIAMSILFIVYNIIGEFTELTNFVYYTKAIFFKYAFPTVENRFLYELNSIATLYYLSLITIIISAVTLAVTTTSIASQNYTLTNESELIEVLKKNVSVITFHC